MFIDLTRYLWQNESSWKIILYTENLHIWNKVECIIRNDNMKEMHLT